ncbi:unnamed protein product [Nippostrongylus brasiliensis]|uniref:Uncharacterized protein n=1 Tax=Nippostrongylus brasiliensis TaxID=27835 RepID=A0A3P7DAU9_NIPBR|nr:unnamed protein product [Nippostrongylus brasiliensis]
MEFHVKILQYCKDLLHRGCNESGELDEFSEETLQVREEEKSAAKRKQQLLLREVTPCPGEDDKATKLKGWKRCTSLRARKKKERKGKETKSEKMEEKKTVNKKKWREMSF